MAFAFFAGLPSSGKSTLANVLMVKLLQIGGRPVTLLDGVSRPVGPGHGRAVGRLLRLQRFPHLLDGLPRAADEEAHLFRRGLPEYTVNVALVEAGVPVLGAVHVPPADCLYLAARELGARRLDRGGETQLRTAPVAHPRRAVVSRSHLSPETSALLTRFGVTETLPRGSSLKMCAVAEGAADLYPRLAPARLWDTAAGTAIAAEAGCDVVDMEGKPLRYGLAGGLVRPGFLVLAPGPGREACLRALAAGGRPSRADS